MPYASANAKPGHRARRQPEGWHDQGAGNLPAGRVRRRLPLVPERSLV